MTASSLRLAPLLAAVLLVAGTAATAEAKTVWLCKPGKAGNPCAGSLTTTVIGASGATKTERTKRRKRPPIDCFYVYPTVSAQSTANATKKIDPELRGVAQAQAARFSQHCRMWAPVYRQLTIAAIGNPALATPAARAKAYGDVRAAWRDYLKNHNRGRGVVLIGHSQGTGMLIQLVRDEVDGKASVRRRLVSALLLGGNVAVRKGRAAGGDFKRVPACRSGRQTGCVVAYSAFNEQPPADTRFGRVNNRFVDHGEDLSKLEVLCTNPAALTGDGRALRPYFPTKRIPGPIGAVSDPPPEASTPWASYPGLYEGRCRSGGGANWLQVDKASGPGDTRPLVTNTLGADWGLHLVDVNIALGNLVDLVRRQSAAYRREARSS